MLGFHLPVLPKRWTFAFKTCSECRYRCTRHLYLLESQAGRFNSSLLVLHAINFHVQHLHFVKPPDCKKRARKHTANMLEKHRYDTNATCTTLQQFSRVQGGIHHRTQLIHSSTILRCSAKVTATVKYIIIHTAICILNKTAQSLLFNKVQNVTSYQLIPTS